MRPERALALVGGGQERLRLRRRDQRQGTIHARPRRRTRGRGQRHRRVKRGHQRKPFLLLRDVSAIALRMPRAGGGRTSPPGPGPAQREVEPLWLVSWTGQPRSCP
jgi:hypothetical protein